MIIIQKAFQAALVVKMEKEMATHSSTFARRIPWMRQSLGSQRVRQDERLRFRFLVVKNLTVNAGDIRDMGSGSIPGLRRPPGGGHGNPLQHSCLENPTDRKAWWATVHGVTKSWTQLEQLSMHAHNYKSNRKQRLKSKRQIQHGVRIGSSLLQIPQENSIRGKAMSFSFLEQQWVRKKKYSSFTHLSPGTIYVSIYFRGLILKPLKILQVFQSEKAWWVMGKIISR